MQKRGHHDFPLKFFVSLPKNFVGDSFGVSKNFGYRKDLCIRGGRRVITILRRKIFVSQYRNILWRNPSEFDKISVIENFMHNRRISLFSIGNFVSQYRKNS